MDLLDPEDVAAFTGAIRDVTDTFHKYPVTLRRAVGGADKPLLAGVKPAGDGKGSGDGELKPRESGEEVDERLTVSFNRGYLAEQGLIDQNDVLLITLDDQLLIKGKRYYLAAVGDKAMFRNLPILVVCEAVR